MNVHELPATPARLRHLAGSLRLSEEAFTRAREVAGYTPDTSRWRALIERFLLVFGVALIIAGVTSFFAYNWSGLHKFWKFTLIEFGIIATVAVAWWRGLDGAVGKSALFAAAFLVGILLAVYGQVYQTGADPYGLFVTWSLLILGWTLIGRQAGLWLLLLILVNLGLILFWTQVLYPQLFSVDFLGPIVALTGTFIDSRLADLVFTLNASALFFWEFYSRRGASWLKGRIFPRVVSLLAITPVLVSSLFLILDVTFTESSEWNVLALFLFAGFALFSVYYYRFRERDLFIMTVCLLGGVFIVTAFVGRLGGGGFAFAFVLAALVVGQTTVGALWLRRVAQEWEEAG